MEKQIDQLILLIRGQKVILDSDLAKLYGVTTAYLNKAVKRNILRFPNDFMFMLSKQEFENLMFQFGTSSFKVDSHSNNYGGRRKLPYAFTEYGIAMLSSVLNSERAIKVNIEIMRTFGRLRRLIASHSELINRLDEMEKKYDKQFRIVFEAIRELITTPKVADPSLENQKKPIGFTAS